MPKKGADALRASSFFILPAQWTPRIVVFNIIKTKGFEAAVIILILANCVFLALEDPRRPPPAWAASVELFFSIAFTVEMVIKWFALGFVLHKGSYLRNSWNMLDFVNYFVFIIQLSVRLMDMLQVMITYICIHTYIRTYIRMYVCM